jgi:hypothetical protein
MRFAYWIPNATDTHSEYVILIVFPLQQWLHIVRCVSLLLLPTDHTNRRAVSQSDDSQYLLISPRTGGLTPVELTLRALLPAAYYK